jgi:hypothetical protein
MSYIRRGLSGVSSQPPGRRVARRALAQLGGVSSQPPGLPVARRALGATAVEYGPLLAHIAVTTPMPPPPPPPPKQRVMRGASRYLAARYPMNARSLGATDEAAITQPTLVDPTRAYQERSIKLAEQLLEAQRRWAEGDKTQKWIQIGVTASIPLFAAIWRAIGLRRR